MKVYLVREYLDDSIDKVFSSYQLAHAYIEKLNKDSHGTVTLTDALHIEEWEIEDASTVPAEAEIVRVLRLVEYEGPRVLVEEQVSRSVHGTKVFAPKRPGKEVRITAVTVGDFSEVLELARQSPEPKLLRDLRERIRNLEAQLREWAK